MTVEIAIAASRPPDRDSNLPDGQAGVRLTLNDWRGVHTLASTGTTVDGLMVGVSGTLRRLELPAPGSNSAAKHTSGYGISLDAFVPIIPAKQRDRSNALSITGSWVPRSEGIADLYSSLNFGMKAAASTPGATLNSTPIDAGLAAYDTAGRLEAVQSRTWILGVQYYFPAGGNAWVSANYSQLNSDNAVALAGIGSRDFNASTADGTIKRSRWADANLFYDLTPAVRMGFEYAWFQQTFGDNSVAHNSRYQFSIFYLF